jgi:hypothetical protein
MMQIKKITKNQYQITERGKPKTFPSRNLAIKYVSFINKERGKQK